MKEHFKGIIVLVLVLILIISCLFLILNDRKQKTEGFNNHCKKMNKYKMTSSSPWILNPELNPDIYKITNAIINSINKKLKINYQLDKLDNVIGIVL